MGMYLLEVYVTNASLNINRPFTYASDFSVGQYCRVMLKFNHADNVGLVISCTYTDKDLAELSAEYGYQILMIESVIDETPVISQEIYELAFWLSRTSLSPFISCLNTMLPKTLKTSKKISNARMDSLLKKHEGEFRMTKRQQEVYDMLSDGMLMSESRKISTGIIKKLLEIGAISEYQSEHSYQNRLIDAQDFKELTPKQTKAYETIINDDKMISLLYGVTGSGKTEVYLHLARYYLSQDKDVLIMVPEISLTPQMIERVKQRFSDVVFYHSELSDQERYEQYKRVKNKEVRIVVGTRSAVFLPFADLGLIIIDEEHDTSYKQDNTPCYHVRNVAVKRALTHNAKVLLASASPSLDSYSRALKGEYSLLELPERINNTLPKIEIVDLNKQVRKKGSYIISSALKEELDNCLSANKQAIILLNRRGYAPIVRCGECGETLMCEDCDSLLSYHKDQGILKCHQCGREYPLPHKCPKCSAHSLMFYGFGTKRVEEELKSLFPTKNIERMDRDNVYRKGAHERILKRFENHETDILIGTQMIAKGLDYPDVTLVGILNADAGLMHQDYNSAKLTFDLLMQASGRAGRAVDPGKVIIQAFNTDHYAIRAVLNQDYIYFYNIEMNYRRKTQYPPYSHLIELIISDINEDRLQKSVNFLYERIAKLPYRSYRPFEISRIQKQIRYRILIMDKKLVDMLKDMQKISDDYIATSGMSRLKIDVDPLYLE